MFRLLSYFALSCAIVLAISTAILVGAYQRHATAELVTATEKQNVAMAQVISNSIWPRFSGYLTGVRITDGDELRARPETAQLHAALSRIREQRGLEAAAAIGGHWTLDVTQLYTRAAQQKLAVEVMRDLG